MTIAFEKAIIFTDIHWGAKNNEQTHNKDCENFITWILAEKERHGAETCIFLGDWHNNRQTLHVSTMNYSLDNMERLNNTFDNFYFILGNHDLFYREKRDISSIAFGRNLKNIKIIDKPTLIGDTAFIPWLIGDEWKTMKNLKAKYIFGHFELPGYMMNAKVSMPDHGTLKDNDFISPDFVFSGHFHARQTKDKIVYIGNAFPHNFADAWDDDRGYMLLEHGQQPQFFNWSDGPKYRTLKLSELLETPEKFITDKTYARVTVDIEINFEEAQFIKETFQNQFNPRRIDFIHQHKNEEDFEFSEDVKFQTVDQIVVEGIQNIESQSIDKALLMEIYKNLN
jgi:DNA repair exonuclease SbcCD nuclease subunit